MPNKMVKINFNNLEFDIDGNSMFIPFPFAFRAFGRIVKEGTLIKEQPASPKTHGYQLWSTPEHVIDIIKMGERIGFTLPVEHLLSEPPDSPAIRSEKAAAENALTVINRCISGESVVLSKDPEITIKEIKDKQPGRLKSISAWTVYLTSATVKNRAIRYIAELSYAGVVDMVKQPLKAMNSNIKEQLYYAILIDGRVMVNTTAIRRSTIKTYLEVPQTTPTIEVTARLSEVISNAINTGLPMEAIEALI
jgi:hypothetical protein